MHGTVPGFVGAGDAVVDLIADVRAAMRQLAAQVMVITALHEGRRSGLTGTAACSLTTDPLSLLVCVNRSSHAHDDSDGGGSFRLKVLAAQHPEVAQAFAGATKRQGEAKFAHGDWSPHGTGAQRLRDALVSVACEVTQRIEVGTHTIVIGRLLEALTAPRQRPLVYADRQVLHLTAATSQR